LSLSAKQRAFLAAYRWTGVVAAAAQTAKNVCRTHYKWLADPEYKAAFAEAQEEAIGVLESEAFQRAKDGVETPVIWRGQLCFEPLRNPKTGAVLHDRKGRPL
jgi:hypothetical protein